MLQRLDPLDNHLPICNTSINYILVPLNQSREADKDNGKMMAGDVQAIRMYPLNILGKGFLSVMAGGLFLC